MQQKQKVKSAKTAGEALASLMRLCARAERSSGDAMRLMASWQVPQHERAGVLRRLEAEKFIDDARYAEAFVREKVSLSAWGEYKIRAALRRKGIADALISEALRAVPAAADDGRLEQRLARKMKGMKYDTVYRLRTKLMRHGLSLGYAMDEVAQCVERITRNAATASCEEEDTFLF